MKVWWFVCVLGVGLVLQGGRAQEDDADASWSWSWDQTGHRSNRAEESKSIPARPRVTPCATSRGTCQNLHADVVKSVNAQINEELKASYVYQAMANYFSRDDVAMRGFAKFFLKASEEETEHGRKLMEYLTKRGGNVILMDITRPTKGEWTSGLQAMKETLEMEHFVNNKLMDIHWLAQQVNDPHLQDFLEGEFLTEQVDAIKQISDYVTILQRMRDTPLGEFMFDQQLYEGKRGDGHSG